MSTESRKNEPAKRSVTWLWTAAVAVAVYVLSIGPAAKLDSIGLLPAPVAQCYAPITWSRRFEPFSSFFTWYVETVWHVSYLRSSKP
jgi:hypothetical protein